MVKSSRYRKNAPMWAAAVTAVMHPRLFGCFELHRDESSSVATAGEHRDGGAGGGGGGATIGGVGAILWFVRSALKTGVKGGGARILRVMTHGLCARLIDRPEFVRLYARELFAIGLSGEGGLTRAERQAMAGTRGRGRGNGNRI